MTDIINQPPTGMLQLSNYPVLVSISVGVVFTSLLVFIAGRFDPTQGTLTI